jgi:hypothetical protein
MLSVDCFAGIGTGMSMDTEIVHPIETTDGKYAYEVKLLCGTISHYEFNPQQPRDISPGGGPINQPPGYYYSYVNISNPNPDAATGEVWWATVAANLYTPGITLQTPPAPAGQPPALLNAFPAGFDTLSCDDLIVDFANIRDREFAALTVRFLYDKKVNVVVEQAVKNVVAAVPFVYSIFYDCIDGPITSGGPIWLETTNLILTNSAPGAADATLVFYDAAGNVVAYANTPLTGRDLDEVNVCRSLKAAGLASPPKGHMIVFITITPPPIDIWLAIGAWDFNCWIVEYFGKFFQNVNEPYKGRVEAFAKTTCMSTLIDIAVILAEVAQANAPEINLVFLNDSAP